MFPVSGEGLLSGPFITACTWADAQRPVFQFKALILYHKNPYIITRLAVGSWQTVK